MGKTTGKGWALLGLIICFLCNLAYVSPDLCDEASVLQAVSGKSIKFFE